MIGKSQSHKYKRRILIIDQKSQWTMILYTFIVTGMFLLVVYLGLTVWGFLDAAHPQPHPHRSGLLIFTAGLSFLQILCSVILAILISNRFAGPVYAVRRNLRWLLDEGKKVPIILRKGDMFPDLARDFNELLERVESSTPKSGESAELGKIKLSPLPSQPGDPEKS